LKYLIYSTKYHQKTMKIIMRDTVPIITCIVLKLFFQLPPQKEMCPSYVQENNY